MSSFTSSGVEKNWQQDIITLKIHTDTTISLASNIDLFTIGQTAAASWNNYSRTKIYVQDSVDGITGGSNDLYFSADYPGFGSGTLGVTITTADEYSGKILEGDIILNSSTISDKNQLSDVMVHEMGHLLGLGHSPVVGATMFYQWVAGQNLLAADDISGIAGKYPYLAALNGEISGRVVGGSALYPIFGVHVMAIAHTTGAIAGATISGKDGSFSIQGLPIGEIYYLYVSPIEQLNPLPGFYASVQNNFCADGKSFVGGFFEGCNRRYQGHPQPIRLENSMNVGNVAIHCGLNVPTNYYLAKESEGMPVMSDQFFSFGEATIGLFTKNEVDIGSGDRYIIDLRGRENFLGKTLKINFLSHSLMTELSARVVVKDKNGIILSDKLASLQDENYASDLTTSILLSAENSADNIFTVEVVPISNNIFNVSGAYWGQIDIRPLYFINFYLSDGYDLSYGMPSNALFGGDSRASIEDESSCSNAPNAYALEPNIDLSALNTIDDRDKQAVLSCATIDFKEPPSGGNQFFVTFFLLLGLSFFPRYYLKR